MKSADWIGHRNGQLTIVAFEGMRVFNRGRSAQFRFRCDCGSEFIAQKSNVIPKRTHCGCLTPRTRPAPAGASRHPLHKVWWHMIDRCENPQNKSFKDYGARGIKVCDRWHHGDGSATGFECFVADMGEREPGMTIERIDGAKDYGPGNCKWLPKAEQSRNKRDVMLLTIGGITKTIPEWCAETGVSYSTAKMRMRRGWDPIRAVSQTIDGRATRAR